MKIFFTNSFLESCHYVRALLPLRELGADGDKTSLRTTMVTEEQRAKGVMNSDIVVFHRPNDDRSLEVAKILRSQGKKIVMDNDDTYKGFDQTKLGKLYPKIDNAIDDFGKYADLITSSTDFLAEEYRKLNPNVVVLPNCVAPEDWPDEDEILRSEDKKVRIGLVGSVGWHNDVAHVVEILRELSKREDIQLVLFCLPIKDETTAQSVQKMYEEEYKFWDGLKVEWQHFVNIREYIPTLNGLELDMMIIPRSDDYFNHCKSNLKFLEASMLEIPVIAQGFPDGKSPYQDPEDAKHMTVVVDNSKWIEEIDKLVNDKELRREMGRKAREYVIGRYSIDKNIHLWEQAYQTLLS